MKLKYVKPAKLRKLIQEFMAWHPLLHKKDYAEGRCYDMTCEFIRLLYSNGIAINGIRAIKADKLPEYKKYYDSHWIVWIDGLHIDFTARQFHHAFACPRIWRGKHGCVLKEMSEGRKSNIGIPIGLSAWEYKK